MRIKCRFCALIFNSLIVDRQLAFKQICEKHIEHLKRKHPEELQRVGKGIGVCQTALIQYMSITNLADTLPGETWITENLDKLLELVMSGLGFDAEDAIAPVKIEDNPTSIAPVITEDNGG